MAEFLIGTSGWVYPDWKGKFYPQDLPQSKWFDHYAKQFKTVEINNSFYRLPSLETAHNWHDQAPPGFKYAVKISRFLTHLKQLVPDNRTIDGINRFCHILQPLGDRAPVILIQLPPQLQRDEKRLGHFLDLMHQGLAEHKLSNRLALETRHASWQKDSVYKLLHGFDTTWVIAQSRRFSTQRVVTTDVAYVRFHGPRKLFASKYTAEELDEWRDFIKQIESDCRQVYVYFNNDYYCYAITNTKYLIRALGI